MRQVRRLLQRSRRRRALLALRAHLTALGRDPGNLLTPTRYRHFCKGLRQYARALARSGASAETAAAADAAFGKAGHGILWAQTWTQSRRNLR